MSVFIVHKKEFIFILLFSIIYIIKIYLSNKLKAYFYNDILNDISQINLILIYLIEKNKSRRINKQYSIQGNPEKTISELNEKINSNVIKFILCISSFIFIFIYVDIQEETPIDNIISIIITILIEIKFFKKRIYLHQTIPLISLFFILFIKCLYQKKGFTNKLIIPKVILTSYSFSFSISLIKYLNTNYFINIYLIGGLVGIINFIIDIFMNLIKNYSNYKELFLIENKKDYFYLFLLYFIHFIYHFLFYQILYKLGVMHSIISIKLVMLIYCFYFGFIEEIIFNTFAILLSLLYLEIIVFNFCGINKNIESKVIERGEKGMTNLLDSSLQSNTSEI